MECSLATVRLDQIASEDHFFRISCATDVVGLTRSLDCCGVLNPPIVVEREPRLSVVSGFGRLAAAGRLGWEVIPVRVLNADTPPELCARIAIVDNSSQRPLNTCEQIRSIRLLSQVVPDPEAVTIMAQSCGLPVNRKITNELSKVAGLPDILEPGLISGAIALPVAVRLAEMPEKRAATGLGILLMELDLSLNRQREIIDWIEAIASRENVNIQDVLECEELGSWRKDAQIEPRQRATRIRQFLKSRRYPALTAAEHEFAIRCRRFKLPDSIQLMAPQGFEGRTYGMQLKVTRLEDLVTLQKELGRLARHPEFQSLFR